MSLMFVPVRNSGRAIGVFSIQSYTPQAYDDTDLESLQTLADHCAGALQRIRAEEKLHQRERRFRLLIENSSDGIYLVGPDGQVAYASPPVSKLLGYGAISGDLNSPPIALVQSLEWEGAAAERTIPQIRAMLESLGAGAGAWVP